MSKVGELDASPSNEVALRGNAPQGVIPDAPLWRRMQLLRLDLRELHIGAMPLSMPPSAPSNVSQHFSIP